MRFWKTLIPDEPLISDGEATSARYLKIPPPAVRGWCLVSIVANSVVVALAAAIFRNAAPLLLGAIVTLFRCIFCSSGTTSFLLPILRSSALSNSHRLLFG
jgi:hypothetical protein